MRRTILAFLVFFFLLPALLLIAGEVEDAQDTITVKELEGHLKFLASDRMEGRLSGEEGCEKAADYIRREFSKYKLSPGPGCKNYEQNFEINLAPRLGMDNVLKVTYKGKTAVFSVAADFLPFPFSANGKAVKAEVVFAGYGITAPEYKYDDYESIDVKGKIVLIMRHEPQEKDKDSVFKGTEQTEHSHFSRKVLNAQKHGAAGVIVSMDPNNHDRSEDTIGNFAASFVEGVTIPAIHVKLHVAEFILQESKKELADAQTAIDKDLKPCSFEVEKKTVTLEVELKREKAKTANIIAFLEGSDPVLKNEVVIVGAHYDHIGKGMTGLRGTVPLVEIFNGADDNASGTVAVLEIAEAFSKMKTKPKRSILFVAFTAEERGLLGSLHYVENPLFPLDKTVFMLNLDMVGRSEGKANVNGTQTGAGLDVIVQMANNSVGANLAFNPNAGGGSDHVPFLRKEIPVLFIITGMHKDYHKPTDDWDKINYPVLEKVARLGFSILHIVANAPNRIQFTRKVEQEEVFVGIEPQENKDSNTVVVKSVVPGSPAEKAELKPGDVIVEFDGRPVKTVQDITDTLSGRKAGDEVAVTVSRAEEQKKLTITLAKKTIF